MPVIRTAQQGPPRIPAPEFAGAMEAVSDGSDAVVLRWPRAVDDTPAGSMRYQVYIATSPGAQDYSSPDATVVGVTSLRVTRLTEATTYHFVVRARDAAAQTECNTVEVTATPVPITGCMDFSTEILPVFEFRCTRCHGGTPERGLQLLSHARVLAGSDFGEVVVPCQPDSSLLYLKVAHDMPPRGEQMPPGGPFLDSGELERLRLWIEQGATEACPEDAVRCADVTQPNLRGDRDRHGDRREHRRALLERGRMTMSVRLRSCCTRCSRPPRPGRRTSPGCPPP